MGIIFGEIKTSLEVCFVSSLSPIGYNFFNPCVPDTRQTENLPENQEICIGNGGERRISVFL